VKILNIAMQGANAFFCVGYSSHPIWENIVIVRPLHDILENVCALAMSSQHNRFNCRKRPLKQQFLKFILALA
jgi:hypothetical protein